jgi:hypothetical protein
VVTCPVVRNRIHWPAMTHSPTAKPSIPYLSEGLSQSISSLNCQGNLSTAWDDSNLGLSVTAGATSRDRAGFDE